MKTSAPLETSLQQSRVIVIFSAFILLSSTLISWTLVSTATIPVPITHCPVELRASRATSSSPSLSLCSLFFPIKTLILSFPWPDTVSLNTFWYLTVYVYILDTWKMKVNSFKFLLLEILKDFPYVFEDIFWTVDHYFFVFFQHLFEFFFIIHNTRKIIQMSIVVTEEKQDCQVLRMKKILNS